MTLKAKMDLDEREKDEFDNITYDGIAAIEDVSKLKRLERYMREEGFEPTAEAARKRLFDLGATAVDAKVKEEAEADLKQFKRDLEEWQDDLKNQWSGLEGDGADENFHVPIRGCGNAQASEGSSPQNKASTSSAAGPSNPKIVEIESKTGNVTPTQTDGCSTRGAGTPANTERLFQANANQMEHQKHWQSEREKEKGNEHFRAKEYDAAIESYTLAINLNPGKAPLHANRAAAYLKIKKYEFAETDSMHALSYDKTYIKGWLRRAFARFELKKHKEALEDVDAGLALDPTCKELLDLREKCRTVLAKQLINSKQSRRMVIEEDSDDESASECESVENADSELTNSQGQTTAKSKCFVEEKEEEIEEIFNPMLNIGTSNQKPPRKVMIEEISRRTFR
ncbi:hypothetical protein BSKO_04241 [Bryopsis sp. KO-2023]|nr:hypothetical protein BSKO_04241 [Bryopsis sp. KO-2023]